MSFFNKKISINSIKKAADEKANKLTETTKNLGSEVISTAKNKTNNTYQKAKDNIQSFDYSQLKNKEFYQKKASEYTKLGFDKIISSFKSTFEIDKTTMDIVSDIRNRLPIPANTIDDIFEQCKQESIRRAVAQFFLNDILNKLDNRSEEKYSSLTDSYADFSKGEGGYLVKTGQNYTALNNQRENSKNTFQVLEDGYNKSTPLYPHDSDIEHIISKKEYSEDFLISIGTDNKQLAEAIDSEENLIFTQSSVNRSLGEGNILEYLEKRGVVHTDNPDLVDVYINGKSYTINKKDAKEALDNAIKIKRHHQLNAAKEVGVTAVKTGMAMSIQQVVGLIVVETIDIFIDEIKEITKNGKIINSDGWLKNIEDTTSRIRNQLSERFEERNIWQRAKTLGIESGITGALSVIPQIIISMVLKVPSLVLAMIRESTLSIVRCVRILASDDDNKFDSIKIVLAGAATAVVGIYVGRSISTAIAGIPLLNKFNKQITDILTGLLIIAIPLAAIYIFEQNKNKLKFSIFSKEGKSPA